ncbi:MAG TPA: nucleotide exchange factor GrpE [Micromonosporaceae bacterium]
MPAGERKVGPAKAGPTEERIVVRDKRKINTANQSKSNGTDRASENEASPTTGSAAPVTEVVEGEVVDDRASTATGGRGAASEDAAPGDSPVVDKEADVAADSGGAEATATEPGDAEAITGDSGDPEAIAGDSGDPEAIAEAMRTDSAGVLGAELEALRHDVDELTRDLQRVSAEYANYRKRVDRDRGVVSEQATGVVLAALLPVLDDLDRAREHGDLVGPFGSVAEQLVQTLSKFGLQPFGDKGDRFDPTRHEAVAHQTSAEVTEPTCVDVLRRGYMLGERLLRPALVAVAEPE